MAVKRTPVAESVLLPLPGEALLRGLYEIAVAAATNPDPQAVARLTVEVIRRLTWADGGAVFVWDEDTGRLQPLHESDLGSPGGPSELGDGIIGHAFQRGEPVAVTDYQTWPHRVETGVLLGIRGALAVPISGRNGRIGAIGIWSRGVREIQNADVTLLSRFAAEVAPILESVRRQADRSRLAESLESLHRVAVLAGGSLEASVLVGFACETAREMLGVDAAHLYWWDESREVLELVGSSPPPAQPLRELPVGLGASGLAFERGAPVVVEDQAVWEHAPRVVAGEAHRSVMAVPLKVRDRSVGAVGVGSTQHRRFTPLDVRQLTLLAAQVAPAVESARLNASLSDSEARLRGLVENLDAVTYVRSLEPEARILYASPQARRLLGLDAASLLMEPDGWLHLLHPDDRARVAREWEVAAATGVPFRSEYRIVRPEGDLRWMRDQGRIVTDDHGRRLHFQGVVFDITESRAAEEELRTSQQQLEALLGNSPVILFALDPAGRFTSVRGRALQDFGIDPERVIGRLATDLSPDRELDAWIDRALGGAPVQFSIHDSRINRDLEVWARPHFDSAAHVAGVVGVAVDVTERSRAEAAERDSEAKSRFLAGMSHELRTPLNSILGFAQLMLRAEDGELSERQRRYAGHIEGSGKHLLALINDVLDLSQVEAGQMSIRIEKVVLNSFLQIAIDRVLPLADTKGLELGIAPGPRLEVDADRRRLDQVLMNLLSNAIKFTPAGGWVTVVAREAEGWVCVDVSDSGPGISAEDQERIFRDFVQLEPGSQNDQPGTGLGLALSRRLLDLMGGRLTVLSELGRGSVFTIWLPGRQAARKRAQAPVMDAG